MAASNFFLRIASTENVVKQTLLSSIFLAMFLLTRFLVCLSGQGLINPSDRKLKANLGDPNIYLPKLDSGGGGRDSTNTIEMTYNIFFCFKCDILHL